MNGIWISFILKVVVSLRSDSGLVLDREAVSLYLRLDPPHWDLKTSLYLLLYE